MINDEEMAKPRNSGNASASSSFNHYFDIRHSSFGICVTSYTPALRVTPATASLPPLRSKAGLRESRCAR